MIIRNGEIHTDAQGRPFVKPELADYPDSGAWLRAMWKYQDQIIDCSNAAFDEAWRKALKASPH